MPMTSPPSWPEADNSKTFSSGLIRQPLTPILSLNLLTHISYQTSTRNHPGEPEDAPASYHPTRKNHDQ